MKHLNKYIVVVIVLVTISFGCKKKEDKILGTWKYIYMSAAEMNSTETWMFNEDKSLIRTKKADTTIAIDTAIWSINKDFFNGSDIVVSDLDEWFDGTYHILTLNRKYLILQRTLLPDGSSAGAFRRAEFKKEK